jgi:type II secretory pathway pseudopilin PulG
MLNENKINFFKINQKGFTLIELLLVSLVSIILLGLIVGIFQSQTGIFTRELNQGTMEANGRSVIDFLSRGVQNAGYNISRGSRFVAASDHYISLVFDEDDDGVIQNDEIFTYALSNTTESISSSFSISPYFDFDDNGRVDRNETRDYEIELSLSNPPFNLYLFTPNKNDETSLKNIAARNIDNLIIRYYDKNDDALPEGVNIDINGSPIPPYTLSSAELNKVRKIEFEVVVRSKDEDSRENYMNNGNYVSGSVAIRDGDSYIVIVIAEIHLKQYLLLEI